MKATRIIKSKPLNQGKYEQLQEVEPNGTLRLILHDEVIEVHYTLDIEETETCGNATIGIDKGYIEVFVDSNGDYYGKGLGKILSTHSDKLKTKYQARNKLIDKAKFIVVEELTAPITG